MFENGMTPEKFKERYGYIPGSDYQGGQIDQTASGVDGDHIITRTDNTAVTYNMKYYRQQITLAHVE